MNTDIHTTLCSQHSTNDKCEYLFINNHCNRLTSRGVRYILNKIIDTGIDCEVRMLTTDPKVSLKSLINK